MTTKTKKSGDARTGACGVLDAMSWRSVGKGTAPFRCLPLIDQHTILMKAWDEKGDRQRAQGHALKVFYEKMERKDYQGAAETLDAALECGLTEPVKTAAGQLHWEIMNTNRMRKYEDAEAIAEKYRLYPEQYEHKMRKRDFQGALDLAKEHGLGEGTVKAAVIKLYENHMQGRDYTLALLIAEEYTLIEHMKRAASEIYKEQMELRHYAAAARIAKKGGLQEMMKHAALEAYKQCVWKCEFDEARTTAEEYCLGEGLEETVLEVCETSIRLACLPEKVLSIAEAFGLADRIAEVALKVFHGKVQNGNYEDAMTIAKEYGLKKQERFLTDLAGVLGEQA